MHLEAPPGTDGHPGVLAIAGAIDPVLPGLGRLLDPAVAARTFAAARSGLEPALRITACAIHHVRWTPGVACIATYSLTLVPRGHAKRTTIGVVVVEPGEERRFLYDTDPDLPGIARASDPVAMTGWLSEQLGSAVTACTVTPVSYRPGRRCVLRYDLRVAGETTVLYGKLLAGEAGTELASTVTSLGLSIAPALVAYSPEWQLVVLADAGQRLTIGSRRALTGRQRHQFESGGRLLGRLHATRLLPSHLRSLTTDIDELERYLSTTQRISPPAADLLRGAVECLRGLDESSGRAVVSHGAFRLDQMCFKAETPALIDLDSCCRAEPERDVANLLAYLRWLAIRYPHDARIVDEIRAIVVASYEREMKFSLDASRLHTYEAASLLKIAGRRYRRLAIGEWARVPDAMAAALALLSGAR